MRDDTHPGRDPGFLLFVSKNDGPSMMLRMLTDVAAKIQTMERVAYNIDSTPDETEILVEIA